MLPHPDVHRRLFREREGELIRKAQLSQFALTDIVKSRRRRPVQLPRLRARLRPSGDAS